MSHSGSHASKHHHQYPGFSTLWSLLRLKLTERGMVLQVDMRRCIDCWPFKWPLQSPGYREARQVEQQAPRQSQVGSAFMFACLCAVVTFFFPWKTHHQCGSQ